MERNLKMFKNNHIRVSFINQKGSTIIENIMAISLFAGVVIILSGLTIKLISSDKAERKAQALSIAQNYMEKTLFEKKYADEEINLDKKWKVIKQIKKSGNRVGIYIRVFYSEDPFPLVELKTIRLEKDKEDLQ